MLAFISSCTVQKRRYTGGFHLEWFGNKGRKKDADNVAVSDTSLAAVDSKSPIQPIDSIVHSDHITLVATTKNETKPISNQMKQEKKSASKQPSERKVLIKSIMTPQANNVIEDDNQSSGSLKKTLSLIACGLIILGLVFVAMAINASMTGAGGFADLGFIALAVLTTMLAGVFAIIAMLLYRRSGEPIPWYQWLAFIYGGIVLVLGLILFLTK